MSNPFYQGGLPNAYSYVRPPYVSSAIPQSMMSQPVQPQAMPAMQQMPVPQSNIIWVNSIEEIANYPTGKGWQQFFGDKNKEMIYVRDTDLNGVTQPIKKLAYTIVEDPEPTQSPPQQVPDNYVTKEEFNNLASSVKMMTEKLSDLLK